jgi:hypothetical protein
VFRWEDNITMDLKERMGHMDRIRLAQGRSQWWAVVNTIMNLHFPK